MENYQAYKYNESMIAQIESICQPLKTLGLTIFGYHKIFPDGSYISISNNLEWKKFYFDNVKTNPIIWEKCTFIDQISNPFSYIPYIWPSEPNSLIEKYLYDHGIWHGFQYIKYSPEYFELWAVATDISNTNIRSFYLRNNLVLLKFIHYFNQKAEDIIKVSNPHDIHKLAKYDSVITLPNISHLIEEQQQVEAFSQVLNNPVVLFKTPRGNIILTKRELNCLELLAKGHTYKSIANKLNISTRTVEAHMNNIKIKTGYSFRSDLFNLYQDNL